MAVSMGEVAAQTGLPGWTGPRELGGLKQSPLLMMMWGAELQGLLLLPFGCCCRQFSTVFPVPVSRSFVGSLRGLGQRGDQGAGALTHG